MESVSHCDERSLLASQRQQIMSILQVTVLWVTTFFILFVSVTPQHLVMSPEVSGVQICIKSCDAQEQQLNGCRRRWSDAARWHQDVASCARSERNNHSLSLLADCHFMCLYMAQWLNTLCRLYILLAQQHQFLSTGLSVIQSSVEEVYLVLPCWSLLIKHTETILSSYSVLLLTLNSVQSVEISMRKQDLPSGSHI